MGWRKLCYSGLAAAILAWIVIGLSWWFNRGWFVYTRDAYSDFGGAVSCCPGLYNYGLMIVGAIMVLFSACIVWYSVGKLEVLGGGFLSLAGIFLALIGLFPSGHRHHVFVSTWFFVQANLALILLFLGLWKSYKEESYKAILILQLLAFPIAIIVELLWSWSSAAVIETYGIILIDIGVLAAVWHYTRINTRQYLENP
jgi:hypothetical membrane protein